MKNLIIIGAGGFGRELFGVAREAVGFGTEFVVKGFLDDNLKALDGFTGYPKILGTVKDYVPAVDDVFITALGSIDFRRRCAAVIAQKGGKFISVIHKSVFIGPNVKIGDGCYLAPNSSLTADIRLGSHVCVFHSSSVGHDSVLGDFSHVYAQCSVGGAVELGEGAIVYPGSVVVPRRRIGKDAVVGAGSTVFLDVEPGVTVIGNPAAPIR